MADKFETKRFVLTVEGETEQWYFTWLRDQINTVPNRAYNASIEAKVEQSPKKFYKGLNAKTTPNVYHICDIESNEQVHVRESVLPGVWGAVSALHSQTG